MRDIKFRLILKGKIVGYERLTQRGWEWMFLSLNPDSGERWTRGVIESSKYIRNQYTCFKDRDNQELYEGDIIMFTLQDGTIEYGVIRFSDDGFWTSQKKGYHEELLSDELSSNLDYKKIGNIHQNPELITL